MTALRLKGGTLQDWRDNVAKRAPEQKRQDSDAAALRAGTHLYCPACKTTQARRAFLKQWERNIGGLFYAPSIMRICNRCRMRKQRRQAQTG